MTLSLNYNDDLSRVQISITDLPFSEGTVRIERSTNELYWQTVRGATALPIVGSSAAVDDYEFTADTENFYRVSVRDRGGLWLPGVSGAYASTPDHSSLQITGPLDLRADVDLPEWSNGAIQVLIGRYNFAANDRSYGLSVNASGQLRLNRSPNGTTVVGTNSTAAVPIASGRLVVRATYDSATGAVRFYTSSSMSGPWAQLGSTVSTTPGTIHAGSSPLEVGAWGLGTADFAVGAVRAVQVRDGVDGPVVAAPVFTAHATDTTVFTDSVGREWTVHGDARVVGDPVFSGSITPSLDGKAWLKSIRHPFLNRPIHRTLAGGGQSISRAARGAVFDVQGRSTPVAVTDVRSSREFTLTVQVPDEAAARDMDLTLASGDVFFLQIPPDLAPHMTGGYVRIGESTQHREADTIRWRFTIPCTVVAPPGPGVVGTTMTWGGVFRLYGSWDALVASNPTWGDLLATVGSPDDLVVL